MFVCGVSKCMRTHVHEHLQLILRSLQDLDQRRVCQQILVWSVLEPQGVLLKTALDPPEPNLIQDQDLDLDCGRLRDWEENVLQLKEQLRTLRSRDAGLVSELQELDRQILALRLDTPWSHDPPPILESPTPDSRPSSGFFDFSDGASLSNSVFSLCSALDPEATPTSPVTTTEALPLVSDVNHPALLQRSLSAPSSGPSSSSSGPSSLQESSAPPLPPPPVSHLDRYISSLLQRRSLTPTQTRAHRPVLIQTSLSHRPPICPTAPLTPPTVTARAPLMPPTVTTTAPSTLPTVTARAPLSPPTVTATAPLRLNLTTEWTNATCNEVQKADNLDKNSTDNKLSRFNLHKTPQNAKVSLEHSVEDQKFKDPKQSLKLRKVVDNLRSQTEERVRAQSGFKHSHTSRRRFVRDCAESKDYLRVGFKEKIEKSGGVEEQIGRRSRRNHRKHLSSTKTTRTETWECSIKSLKSFSMTTKRGEKYGDLEEFEEERGGFKKQDGPSAQRRNRGRRRRSPRRSGAEDDQDRASLRSHCVKSCRVKHWTKLSQSQSSRAVMSQERPIKGENSEEGGTEEETGIEGEHIGRGGARRQHLIRIKASQNLKRRILRQKTGTFTLMTTV